MHVSSSASSTRMAQSVASSTLSTTGIVFTLFCVRCVSSNNIVKFSFHYFHSVHTYVCTVLVPYIISSKFFYQYGTGTVWNQTHFHILRTYVHQFGTSQYCTILFYRRIKITTSIIFRSNSYVSMFNVHH